MPDLIQQGQLWEAEQRKANRSILVEIRRGGASTPNVPATVGQTTQVVQDSSGLMYQLKTRDFIIDRADYRINTVLTNPQDGDRIIDSSSGAALTYKVMPDTGIEAARWSDQYGIAWRISTKQVPY